MADPDRSIENTPIAVHKEKLTFVQRLAKIMNNITVEPTAFFLLFASVFSQMATQNLSIEKACRVNLNMGDVICDALISQDTNETSTYEKQVQQYIAFYIKWKSVISTVLPTIIFLFVGGWMDMTGRRKAIIMLPIIGELFQSTSNILNVIFFYQLRVEYLIFFDAFFGAISGGWSVMFLAIFSYIADVTTEVNRTHRLGMVGFCTYVAMPIGLGLSGIMLKNFGYFLTYGTAISLHFLNLLYIIFAISDPPRTKEQKEHDGQGFLYCVKSFFDPSHIKNTLTVVFKKTDDNRRGRLCALLGTVFFLFGPMYGEAAILYMSTRYRFNWDEVQYSIFQTYHFVTHTIGTIISILVFSKKLQWHDAVLGIISTVSKIAASFVYCFASSAKVFYVALLVDMMNATAMLSIRSIFSKSVAPDELGKVNSVMGLAENLTPLVYVSLYTSVYTATMEVLPGAVYLMGAAMTIPAVFVFIWLFVKHRKSLRKGNEENGTEIHAD